MYSHDAKAKGIRLIFTAAVVLLLAAGCATTPSQQEQQEKAAINTITGVEAESGGETGKIEVQSSGQLDYTSVKQRDPIGVIFYFPKARLGDIDRGYTPGKGVIRSIDLSSSEDQQNVRMEVRLARDLRYKTEKSEGVFTVKFDETPRVSSAQIDTAAGTATDSPNRSGADTLSERDAGQRNLTGEVGAKESKTIDKADKSGGPAVIKNIEFETLDSGKSVIVVGAARPLEYDIQRTRQRRLKLVLPGAVLPEHMDRRPFITTRFDSAVDRIIPYKAPTEKDAVEIVIELREDVPYHIERADGRLMVNLEASDKGPRPYTAAKLPDWKQVLEEEIRRTTAQRKPGAEMPAGKEARTRAEAEARAEEVEWLFEKEEYTGEKVALDFYETDIRNVFRILQQVSGKNYAIDPDVEGKVTISMEKPVPWDQILDLVLEQNRLGKVERGDMIRIATRQSLREEEKAKQERIEAYKKRKEQEEALEPLVTEYIPINYANAENEVLSHIKDVLSDRGKANVDTRNNQLILTDTADRIEKAREVIEQIDQVTPQVVIEARIVEINENYLKDIGSQFSMTRGGIQSSTLGGEYGHSLSMNNPAQTASNFGFSFTNLGTPLTLDATLTAMEEENNVKIISSPKIATLDNKTAKITQGFEYPYQTVEDNEVNIEFKDIDLTLEVTPHVTPDKRIALQIYVTKNDVAEQTAQAPALSTNEAETELLVNDGSTIVIGGIKKDTIHERVSGFPVLKDIPMLGWLFKRKFDEREKSELVIFITPRIVQLDQRGLTRVSND
ncbi:MAG: type IV pilus secretin PilQ [Desulfobacteraceae bacterium]|nr:type IV pilus secretin PilQ [Desulfobacteraceae bacterium]